MTVLAPGSPAPLSRPHRSRSLLLGLLLLASALYLVALSHVKFFWTDEALTFYTIHGRTLHGLFAFQASTPVVLEPPTHDLIEWAVGHILGYSKLALRLPSVLFFVLVQYLLYRLATLVGGYRAGLLAALLLIGTEAVTYGAEARPYALLTALTLAAPLLWFHVHTAGNRRARLRYAAALAAVVALAVTTQFLGALAVGPVLLAELALCLSARRRPSLPVLAALAAGLVAIALDIPYLRAVRPYRPAMPFNVEMRLRSLPPVYTWGFLHEPKLVQRFLSPAPFVWILLLGSIALSVPFARPAKPLGTPAQPPATTPPGTALPAVRFALWAALTSLALYPVPVLLVAHFATHYFQPRYAVQCIPGLAALLAVALTRFTGRLGRAPLVLLALAAVLFVAHEDRTMLDDTDRISHRITDPYQASPAVRALLLAQPGDLVYLPIDQCMLYPFYGDPAFASRIRCLYSGPVERRFGNTELTSLTTHVLTAHTDMPFPAVSFEDMRTRQQVLFAYAERAWLAWLPAAIAASHAQSDPVGTGFGGTVYRVHLPQPAP